MRTNLNRKSFDEDKAFKVFFGLWLVWALICLSLFAGAVYVAIHFIAKFW